MIWELAAAVANAKDGDVVLLPPEPILVPSGGIFIDKQIALRGQAPGRNRLQCGTKLYVGPDHVGPIVTISTTVGNVTLEDMIIDGQAYTGQRVASFGILCSPAAVIGHVDINRVDVWRCATGMSFSLVNNLRIRDSGAKMCGVDGITATRCEQPVIQGGLFARNGRCGIRIDPCGDPTIRDAAFEANQQTAAGADVLIHGESGALIDGCVFEDFAYAGNAAIVLDAVNGAHVTDCRFIGNSKPATCVRFVNGARGRVDCCKRVRVPTRVEGASMFSGNVVQGTWWDVA